MLTNCAERRRLLELPRCSPRIFDPTRNRTGRFCLIVARMELASSSIRRWHRAALTGAMTRGRAAKLPDSDWRSRDVEFVSNQSYRIISR